MMMTHLTDEQKDEIQAYLNRHLHLFRDPDFIDLVRSGDLADAVACARLHTTVLPRMACGNLVPEPDSLRYGAFLLWLERKLASLCVA